MEFCDKTYCKHMKFCDKTYYKHMEFCDKIKLGDIRWTYLKEKA